MREQNLKVWLRNSGGWTRVKIAISTIWLLFSLVAYVSGLGFYRGDTQLTDLWNSLTPSFMSAYDEIERPGPLIFPNLMRPDLPGSPIPMYGNGFSLSGFFFFVLFPVIIVWLAGWAIGWVREGFKTK